MTEPTELSPSAQPGLHMGRSLAQIVIVLVVLLVLANIPLGNYSNGLAQLVPQSSALVIHDGLLLKGSGPQIYLVEDYKLRPFSSPEAFDQRFRLEHVVQVEDSLLEQLGQGQPVRRLLRCPDSPAIYALENGRKRWLKEPPPAPAHSWDRATTVQCSTLRRMPDGLPIPEDAGSPPQPLVER